MNHGSSSFDVVLELKNTNKKNQNPSKHNKSRGIRENPTKIFPELNPLALTDQLIDTLAREMHQKPTPRTNPCIPAAYTYFGQFVSHDLTIIPKKFSKKSWKFRNQSPCLDLDSVYGVSPGTSRAHVDKYHLFTLSANALSEADLPRDERGQALIADPRNDMSVMISQMHLCFLKFHNAIVRKLKQQSFKGDVYREAIRISQWHYQWVVVHDYLKRLVGEDLLYNKISSPLKKSSKIKLRYIKKPGFSHLPLEFTGAAYRMGHSMIRAKYYLNEIPNSRNIRTGRSAVKAIQIFDFDERGIDLRAGRILPPYFSLQWNRFLEFPHEPLPQYAQRIDTCMNAPMSRISGDEEQAISMAKQNLSRGRDFDLASGQEIAKTMGLEVLPDLGEGQETPLWYYILQEAEHHHQGKQLGPVGAHLVSEVFLSKLYNDPHSFFSTDPSWNPKKENFIPSIGKEFELRDIVSFAQMPINRKDIEKVTSKNQS